MMEDVIGRRAKSMEVLARARTPTQRATFVPTNPMAILAYHNDALTCRRCTAMRVVG